MDDLSERQEVAEAKILSSEGGRFNLSMEKRKIPDLQGDSYLPTWREENCSVGIGKHKRFLWRMSLFSQHLINLHKYHGLDRRKLHGYEEKDQKIRRR